MNNERRKHLESEIKRLCDKPRLSKRDKLALLSAKHELDSSVSGALDNYKG